MSYPFPLLLNAAFPPQEPTAASSFAAPDLENTVSIDVTGIQFIGYRWTRACQKLRMKDYKTGIYLGHVKAFVFVLWSKMHTLAERAPGSEEATERAIQMTPMTELICCCLETVCHAGILS